MSGDGDEGTVFRDLISLTLLGFVALVVMMYPHLNPPTAGDDIAKPAGNMTVEARWPDKQDVDVDLWVLAPGDSPVGYTRKHGAVFDLLRDDLGSESDSTGLNYEFAFCRGLPDGEYVVNVHWYSDRHAAGGPVIVRVVVTITPAVEGRAPVVVASKDIPLRHVGEQITVVRFTLDDGSVAPGSVHDLPKRLRS